MLFLIIRVISLAFKVCPHIIYYDLFSKTHASTGPDKIYNNTEDKLSAI
jgi:hypothetical protein